MFSFAAVGPKYELLAFKDLPEEYDLMREFNKDVKKRNPALRTSIAVGGWTFNDPGPTRTLCLQHHFFNLGFQNCKTNSIIFSLLFFYYCREAIHGNGKHKRKPSSIY
jgi:hypothetical protein